MLSVNLILLVNLVGCFLELYKRKINIADYFFFLVQGLHAINLGDSGFVVVRGGRTIFRSPVQQHGFNFTYQLESGKRGDQPSSGEVKFTH